MSKAILEFDLDSPEEREEHRDALNGQKWKWAMQGVYNKLRTMWKYGDDEKQAEWAEDLWERICNEDIDDLNLWD